MLAKADPVGRIGDDRTEAPRRIRRAQFARIALRKMQAVFNPLRRGVHTRPLDRTRVDIATVQLKVRVELRRLDKDRARTTERVEQSTFGVRPQLRPLQQRVSHRGLERGARLATPPIAIAQGFFAQLQAD